MKLELNEDPDSEETVKKKEIYEIHSSKILVIEPDSNNTLDLFIIDDD